MKRSTITIVPYREKDRKFYDLVKIIIQNNTIRNFLNKRIAF